MIIAATSTATGAWRARKRAQERAESVHDRVRLFDRPSPIVVSWAETARGDLAVDVAEAMQTAELEVGAALYGQRPHGRGLRISRCGTPGEHCVRAAHHFRRDSAHDMDELAAFRAQAPGTVEVGAYHVHLDGDPEPSSADLSAWTAARTMFRLSMYAGVIAVPAGEGRYRWNSLDLQCYGVRPGPLGTWDLCEPADAT